MFGQFEGGLSFGQHQWVSVRPFQFTGEVEKTTLMQLYRLLPQEVLVSLADTITGVNFLETNRSVDFPSAGLLLLSSFFSFFLFFPPSFFFLSFFYSPADGC